MSGFDSRLILINEYIEKEYRIVERTTEIGRKIFCNIQELILHSSPIIWELPFKDSCNEPIQQISAVYQTNIDAYKIIIPITCFDFHTMEAWEAFQSHIGENDVKVLRHNEIINDGVHYIPLTFYSVNKKIQRTFPYSIGGAVRELFFRKELEVMKFSDSYYDWKVLKPIVEDETSRFYRLATAFRDMALRNLMIY